MQPVYENLSAPAFNITADIVINGESCTGKEGNSDYKKWKPNPLTGCAPHPFRRARLMKLTTAKRARRGLRCQLP